MECEKKIADTEQRLHQHRDRTINLLAEKDQEIDLLRNRLKSGAAHQYSADTSGSVEDIVSYFHLTFDLCSTELK